MFDQFKKIDFKLLIVVMILLGIGLVMVYSAGAYYANERGLGSAFFLKQQLKHMIIGVAGLFLGMYLNYQALQKIAPYVYLLAIFLLIWVLINPAGIAALNVRRWIRIGSQTFQPSEFAKYALILFLSVVLSSKNSQIHEFTSGLLPALVIIAPVLGLILWQPNLGTATMIMLVSAMMLIAAGSLQKHILIVGMTAFSVVLVIMQRVNYQTARLKMFLDQVVGKHEPVWQVKQALAGLASGGATGVGLGDSVQKTGPLPQAYDDFIFAVIGEELGFLGVAAILLLFLFLFLRAFKIAKEAPDKGGQLLAFGLGTMIMLYFLFNAAVVVNLVPVTGLPLPFISHGGSALIMNMVAIGVLLNISSQRVTKSKRRTYSSKRRQPAVRGRVR
ncbi:cell division protein FtsW [bacterium]|nr:cell division protein FtsW [bacterium]